MDPYSYLASWGISKSQLAADLKSGFTIPEKPAVDPETPTPGTSTPKPEQPSANYEAKNGTYVFSTETKIRNGLGPNGYYSGIDYKVGQSVNYDRIYSNVDGYDWLKLRQLLWSTPLDSND